MKRPSTLNIRDIKAEYRSSNYILTFHLSKKKLQNEMTGNKNFALEISYELQNYDKNG